MFRDPESLYDFFKKLTTEICLSIFLDVDFEKSPELAEDIVNLTTLQWHGKVALQQYMYYYFIVAEHFNIGIC